MWYLPFFGIFFKKGFKFQSFVCNRCHDLFMISMNLSNNPILKIKNANYYYIVTGISKREVIKLL